MGIINQPEEAPLYQHPEENELFANPVKSYDGSNKKDPLVDQLVLAMGPIIRELRESGVPVQE